VVNVTPQSPYLQERDQAPTVQETGWAPGLIWMGPENLATTIIHCHIVWPLASCYTD